MRLLVVLVCFAPLSALCGQYTVSKGWPTGIGGQVEQMQEKYRPLCKEVELALRAKGPISGPLSCERSLEGSKQLKRTSWTFLEKTRLFPLAQRLEVLLQKRWGRDARWVESEAFRTNVTKLIESGEMAVSLARVPAAPDGGEMLILRYQRRACDVSNSEHDAGRVVFFSSDSDSLENLQPLMGLGDPTDIFVYGGHAYFDSHAFRHFDDSGTHALPKSQALVHVHRMYDVKSHVRVCRLLYWDEDLTPRSSGRDKSRRSP
jgi:hypothetical protein